MPTPIDPRGQDNPSQYFVEDRSSNQDMMYGFQTGLPFFKQWGCTSEDYDALYEQALIEMQQPDFRATWPMVTAWGTTPSA